MNVKTEIANLALRHLGVGKEIADLSTDTSDEAKTLNSLFDYWMNTVLRGYNWKFATVIVNINPVTVFPNQAKKFAYRYPSDCFFVQRFWNGSDIDDRTNMIPFEFTNDAQGRLILTDWGPSSAISSALANEGNPTPNPLAPITNFSITAGDMVPVIYYTQNFTNIQFVPPDFIWGFAQMLAGWAAPSMSQVGLVDLREKNLAMGSSALQSAMARDAMEAKPPFNLMGELTKSRTGSRLAMTQTGWSMIGSSYTP